MFRKNSKHQQPALISAASELPDKQRTRLVNSWAGTFYREFFRRIDEEAFADLYSAIPSRPNVPVNVLVGLEALKAGFGWSDAELYENYCYNLQVRYALGYDRLGDGDFEIRTLYYFRERLSRYHVEKSVTLLEKAFEQITDAQIVDLKVRTGMQRIDSTQIASNIVSASRLQLLVATLQRVQRILNAADQVRLAETFAPYLKDSAGHYTYRVKGKEAVQVHLQKVGQTMHALLADLQAGYAAESAYQVLERIFTDNFHLVESVPQLKENKELTSDCLQSVDDLDATYRTKGSGHYKGYVANLTETCDPENELQLITKVQVAPNNVDDAQLLAEALPNLKERTDLATIISDGGFGGEASDKALQEAATITHIQTAIRGAQPDPDKFNLSDFDIQQDEAGKPTTLTCPQGQTVPVTPHYRLASPLRPAHLRHLPFPTGRTLPYPTTKARLALSLVLHHQTNPRRPTPQNLPGAPGRQPQLTLGSRSHRAFSETSLPGRQTARTWAIPHRLLDDRLCRHSQCAAHSTLLGNKKKGGTSRKQPTKRAQSPARRGCGFFFCLRMGLLGPLAMGRAGSQPEFCLLKNGFLQWSQSYN